MRIRPLRDMVVVKCEPLEDEKQQGVIVLKQFQRVRHGEVIAVGPGRRHFKTDRLIPMSLKVGQRVAFFRENMETLNGKQISHVLYDLQDEYGGADLAFMPEDAILGEVTEGTRVST